MARCNKAVFLLAILFFFAPAAMSLADPGMNGAGNNSAVGPEPFRITLFIPSPNMIHSDQILDVINTPDKDILFGTSYGLSLYNGTWSTRHMDLNNISQGLMDDYITALEYDKDGNLWIGYSGGIQIYNGVYYRSLRDQQLFKDPRIQDIQRWDDDMWVATGHSGIHRYRDGSWTWFQPMSTGGPGFYEIKEMILDPPPADILYITTTDEGIWSVNSPADPVVFERVTPPAGTFGMMDHVRRDNFGRGVYFFNDTSVVHYEPVAGFSPILTTRDLTLEQIYINDLASASDGRLFLATDSGIYIWESDRVYGNLNRFEGIGTSEVVRTIFIDAQKRIWFSTRDHVGYFYDDSGSGTTIPFLTESLPVTTAPETLPPTPVVTPVQTPKTDSDSGSGTGALGPILDPIVKALQAILAKLGLAPAS